MKLMWQLIVVVLNAHIKFRDNLLECTLHAIFFTRWGVQDDISATIAPFPTP